MLGDGMMRWRLNGSGNRGRPVGGSEWQCYHGEKHEEMRMRTFHVGIRRISTGEIFLWPTTLAMKKIKNKICPVLLQEFWNPLQPNHPDCRNHRSCKLNMIRYKLLYGVNGLMLIFFELHVRENMTDISQYD
jgi:hypothetical protein